MVKLLILGVGSVVFGLPLGHIIYLYGRRPLRRYLSWYALAWTFGVLCWVLSSRFGD